MPEAVPPRQLAALLMALSLTLGGAAGAIGGRTNGGPDTIVTAATVPLPDAVTPQRAVPVADVVAAIAPSVVSINAAVETGDPATGYLLADASGTGFVLRSDGLVATAAHVIRGAWSVSVTFPDGDRQPARVLGVDDATDLAVLSVDRHDLEPVVFGQTLAMRVGDPVIALGHALGLGSAPTVSVGVLSAVERTMTNDDGITYDHLLQTDAAINTGSSGGPLVNTAGEVVGINTAKITSDYAEGIDFAICTDHAVPALEAMYGE